MANDYYLYRQSQFDRAHELCACCGEVTHTSEINSNGDCEACATEKVDNALLAIEQEKQEKELTPTTPNFENSDIAFLMRD